MVHDTVIGPIFLAFYLLNKEMETKSLNLSKTRTVKDTSFPSMIGRSGLRPRAIGKQFHNNSLEILCIPEQSSGAGQPNLKILSIHRKSNAIFSNNERNYHIL